MGNDFVPFAVRRPASASLGRVFTVAVAWTHGLAERAPHGGKKCPAQRLSAKLWVLLFLAVLGP